MADSQKYGRTNNLFDYRTMSSGVVGYYLNSSGEEVENSLWAITDYIPCDGQAFTVGKVSGNSPSICLYDSNKTFITGQAYNTGGIAYLDDITITALQTAKYIRFSYYREHTATNVMLNQGSTALPFQPYYGWQHSLRKLTTATEAVENPLYSDGTAITAYTIKGNTVQDGTPTPSNPVEVNGVGKRTVNLLNPESKATNQSGAERFGGYFPAGTYYIYNGFNQDIYYRDGVSTTTSSTVYKNGGSAIVTATDTLVVWHADGMPTPTIMVAESSIAVPYEPYGYKIPISSGGVTTNIYLSEPLYKIGDYADTIAADGTVTRVIKTYKITGQENWGAHGSIASWFFVDNIIEPIIPTDSYLTSPAITSHFKVRPYSVAVTITNGECTFGHPSGILTQFRTILKNTDYTTVEDFTDWLKAQYNNGNPVTIWYASDTPTTETITAPSIPTTEGANSITVDTTVQPSEFTATWTGWHDATVKEWDGSQWNE